MDESGTIVIDRHLYLTEDRDRVVEENDPASRFLWAAPGDEVSRAEAERLGAVKAEPEPAEDAPESEEAPESEGASEAVQGPKRRTPRVNKARTAAGDKAS